MSSSVITCVGCLQCGSVCAHCVTTAPPAPLPPPPLFTHSPAAAANNNNNNSAGGVRGCVGSRLKDGKRCLIDTNVAHFAVLSSPSMSLCSFSSSPTIAANCDAERSDSHTVTGPCHGSLARDSNRPNSSQSPPSAAATAVASTNSKRKRADSTDAIGSPIDTAVTSQSVHAHRVQSSNLAAGGGSVSLTDQCQCECKSALRAGGTGASEHSTCNCFGRRQQQAPPLLTSSGSFISSPTRTATAAATAAAAAAAASVLGCAMPTATVTSASKNAGDSSVTELCARNGTHTPSASAAAAAAAAIAVAVISSDSDNYSDLAEPSDVATDLDSDSDYGDHSPRPGPGGPAHDRDDSASDYEDDRSMVSGVTVASTGSLTPSLVGETLGFITLADTGCSQQQQQLSPPAANTHQSSAAAAAAAAAVTYSSLPLTDSLFPHVPCTINFGSSTEKCDELPAEAVKWLRWRLSTITPQLVRQTLGNTGFRLLKQSINWLGTWSKHMRSECFKSVRDFQKINHFPGTFQIGRKDKLWKNLHALQLKFGRQEFGFIPRTYVLPADLKALKVAWRKEGAKRKWIIKPPASARGTGIRVIHRWSDVPTKKQLIVQRYVSRPLLIDQRKFDLRLYVYVTSFEPLRVYIYEEGLVRFASVKYSHLSGSLHDTYMHLTNYSVNKHSADYRPDGHKWQLKQLWRHLRRQRPGLDTDALWRRIVDLVLKTLVAGERHIVALQRQHVVSHYCCHELLGFDVLLDERLRPWLLEVNISPSLHSSAPIDVSVKAPMLRDLLNIAGFHLPNRLSPDTVRLLRHCVGRPAGRESALNASTTTTTTISGGGSGGDQSATSNGCNSQSATSNGCNNQSATSNGCNNQSVASNGCNSQSTTNNGCNSQSATSNGCNSQSVASNGCNSQSVASNGMAGQSEARGVINGRSETTTDTDKPLPTDNGVSNQSAAMNDINSQSEAVNGRASQSDVSESAWQQCDDGELRLVMDRRMYTSVLTVQERQKHARFADMHRSQYLDAILECLTPDDVRHLVRAEDELSRRGGFVRIFPTVGSHHYLRYMETQRYHNKLLDAWEQRQWRHRRPGVELLRQLCRTRVHLTVAKNYLRRKVFTPEVVAKAEALRKAHLTAAVFEAKTSNANGGTVAGAV